MPNTVRHSTKPPPKVYIHSWENEPRIEIADACDARIAPRRSIRLDIVVDVTVLPQVAVWVATESFFEAVFEGGDKDGGFGRMPPRLELCKDDLDAELSDTVVGAIAAAVVTELWLCLDASIAALLFPNWYHAVALLKDDERSSEFSSDDNAVVGWRCALAAGTGTTTSGWTAGACTR